MNFDINTLAGISAAAVTAIGGIYTSIHHIRGRIKKKNNLYRQGILDQAKFEVTKMERYLEEKIRVLEIELEDQRLSLSKDLSHFKETHNSEVKALGEKIENLREDLSQQHQALVGLLTKLVDR